MYHSITIGDKNTWDDWHLIPSERPVFLPPDVKTEYIETSSTDGSIDLSEGLSGRPLYMDRKGSWDFYVANDYKRWNVLYSEITSYLRGRRLHAVLEDEPDQTYTGRFFVSAWKSDPGHSMITIGYVVDPYKVNGSNVKSL